MSSQTATISGTTGNGSSHTHTKPSVTVNLKVRNTTDSMSNDYGKNGNIVVTNTIESGQSAVNNTKTLTAVSVGNVGAEAAHTHSFSGDVAFGSGDYIRPYSTSTLIVIKY